MKSPWKVSSQYLFGEKVYQVYRLRDVTEVDHSGNHENKAKIYTNRDEAQAEANRLNEEDI